ncbi:hypothetical protein [Candidatus Methylobacter favarea]|nr:hypothetical protein [Candidatus Methylobacter favarea]
MAIIDEKLARLRKNPLIFTQSTVSYKALRKLFLPAIDEVTI